MKVAEYYCPQCKSNLAAGPESYECKACARSYPIVLGIPDFRVFPDRYLSIAEDHRKGARIAERAADTDFCGLVEYYWSITPEEPPEMARRFTAQAFAAVERGRHLLDGQICLKTHLQRPDTHVLDVGTRTGGLLLAAAERCERVVGIDIAFRWLIIARKRLEEAERSAQLVCCCAEFLPFRESPFDLVLAENVLEHTTQPQQLIEEAHRVLKPAGIFFATTWNRLAAAPEPHVRLWGVGWLPRGFAKRYVQLRKGVDYEHVRLLSVLQLARIIAHTSFGRGAIELPRFSDAELANISPFQRRLVSIYHKMKEWPFIRALLLLLAPVFHVVCVRDSKR